MGTVQVCITGSEKYRSPESRFEKKGDKRSLLLRPFNELPGGIILIMPSLEDEVE